ncbi:hypothetical protein TVAG_357360 [Trichomonas vaginalis G3]|uniref:Uncharacterized protein n=1 Tax=Trichomonas vaginalis (strain ATCC PRA-98 / G3) TaxID=412133 RepID=A2F9N7_TRIV3|nr:hypothetical protein TVAGG3_0429630 [Trichomonas vaginalis G3]EAX98367.1 hypothetical protein TVAG_357360 [Trichomonas vaginalis G3]KAI5536663.1 hypothetical protein TVAGG3_0429630 [Trichomonas vaginalis G3]|eukprot:XP_001311297.1 hypothetical protein [Trichomonas vaginalis G3]
MALYTIDELNKMQKYIDKHPPAVKYVYEGATGGVLSSNCTGFIPQPDGSIIRLDKKYPEGTPGPGAYDPQKPSFLRETLKYVKPTAEKKDDKGTPSSADYTHIPKETKIYHKLNPTDPYPLDPTPLHGDLTHPDWTPKKSNQFPKNRFPNHQFRTSNESNVFFSDVPRKLFSDPPRVPAPDKYAVITDGIGDIQKLDKSSVPFVSGFERFKDPPSKSPSPDTYTLPDEFGNSRSMTMVQDNPKISKLSEVLRSLDKRPDALEYSTPIINKPNTKHGDSFFLSKTERMSEPTFLPPPSTKYDIDRHPHASNISIRSKEHRHGGNWYDTSLGSSPSSTKYTISRDISNKGGYISTIGHRPYTYQPERPLAFRSLHSSLVKGSFNSHYRSMLVKDPL